jgi:Ribosomal protein S21
MLESRRLDPAQGHELSSLNAGTSAFLQKPEVHVKGAESLESLLRRFKRNVEQEAIERLRNRT